MPETINTDISFVSSVDDIKSQTSIPTSNTSGFDDFLIQKINSAAGAMNNFANRQLKSITTTAILDLTPSQYIQLPNFPISSISSAQILQRNISLTLSYTGTGISATAYCDSVNFYVSIVSNLGVETVSTLALATYKTLDSLSTALNLISGITSNYSVNYPTNQLQSFLPTDIKSSGIQTVYCFETLPNVVINDAASGIISVSNYAYFPNIPRGMKITYTAGYDSTINASDYQNLREIQIEISVNACRKYIDGKDITNQIPQSASFRLTKYAKIYKQEIPSSTIPLYATAINWNKPPYGGLAGGGAYWNGTGIGW